MTWAGRWTWLHTFGVNEVHRPESACKAKSKNKSIVTVYFSYVLRESNRKAWVPCVQCRGLGLCRDCWHGLWGSWDWWGLPHEWSRDGGQNGPRRGDHVLIITVMSFISSCWPGCSWGRSAVRSKNIIYQAPFILCKMILKKGTEYKSTSNKVICTALWIASKQRACQWFRKDKIHSTEMLSAALKRTCLPVHKWRWLRQKVWLWGCRNLDQLPWKNSEKETKDGILETLKTNIFVVKTKNHK